MQSDSDLPSDSSMPCQCLAVCKRVHPSCLLPRCSTGTRTRLHVSTRLHALLADPAPAPPALNAVTRRRRVQGVRWHLQAAAAAHRSLPREGVKGLGGKEGIGRIGTGWRGREIEPVADGAGR
jgi:hypothetical protein